MATTYKSLSSNDIVTNKSLLHEAIPITGSITSGSYNDSSSPPVEQNIKNYTHGQFQSVYDYPYLSSSANHIFDITLGCHASSKVLSTDAGTTALNRTGLVSGSKKNNIYNQMAQVLMGYDENGNIQQFDRDGDLVAGGEKIKESYFLNFARLLTKDEIKKGTFSVELGLNRAYASSSNTDSSFSEAAENDRVVKIYDKNALNDYRVNSPAGDYAILYASSSASNILVSQDVAVGLLFYQAGIAVIDTGLFHNGNLASNQDLSEKGFIHTSRNDLYMDASNKDISQLLVTGSIPDAADAFRHRIKNIQFNNTTELNSTVYFCRAHHNEFNYSTNPTYLSSSQIVVKNVISDSPVSYITTVGLYSSDNELMAVAKLSEPLKKDPTNELTLRVRLDY